MALKRELTVKIIGLDELQKALLELPSKATQRNVVRRTLMEAADPIAKSMVANSHHFRRTGKLEESIDVGTKLTTRQAAQKRRDRRKGIDSSQVEVFAGAGKVGHAHLKEFGDFNSAPDPYARPAWDENKHKALDIIKTKMWAQIKAAADRVAKKLLKKRK